MIIELKQEDVKIVQLGDFVVGNDDRLYMYAMTDKKGNHPYTFIDMVTGFSYNGFTENTELKVGDELTSLVKRVKIKRIIKNDNVKLTEL